MFLNDVSEFHRVSTGKYPALIMAVGVVASNLEEMPLFKFEQDKRLTSAVYKEVLETKDLP